VRDNFPGAKVSAMFALEGIDHVALSVPDVEQSAAWYVEVLGFERLYPGMWNGVPVFIGKGSTAIALFPRRTRTTPKVSSPPQTNEADMLHLAMRADRRNFLAAQEELKKRGIHFEFQDHEISHSIYFRNPDGHRLEITTYELA
jgi:catechol 2,3-dioxygenase-like lactoylglutathione lyase family enzyme